MCARMMITSTRCLYLICTAMICIMLLKRTSVDALCNLCVKEGFECHPDSFPCFRDCCLIDQAFCDSDRKICVRCHDLKHRCGNHSMPVECRLFCYKLRAGQNAGPEETFSHSSCIATLCIIGAFSVLLAVTFAMTVMTFRFITKDCPRCSKKLCRKKNKKKKKTEMTTENRDIKEPFVKSPSKSDSSLNSGNSQKEVNPTDLRLATFNGDLHVEASPECQANQSLPETRQTSGPTNVQPTEAGQPSHPVFSGYSVNAPTSVKNVNPSTRDTTPASGTAAHVATHQLPNASQPKLNNIIPSAEPSSHSEEHKPIALGFDDPSKGYRHA